MPLRNFLITCIFVAAAGAAEPAIAQDTITIESFDYPSVDAAQAAWQPADDSPAITLMRRTETGGAVAVIRANLDRPADRACYDRKLQLDLSAAGRISLWVHSDRPDALRNGTIYFRSGGGWYGGWFAIEGGGWRQITLDRGDFHAEDKPAGWASITGVRLSFWKQAGARGEVAIAVDDIQAHTAPIRVVYGSLSPPEEARSAKQYCDRMGNLLQSAGVPFVTINDTDVETGGLTGAKVAIFPHNPNMSGRETDTAVKFIQGGGKVMAFYSIPPRLAEAIGVKLGGWRRAKYEGELAQVRFEEPSPELRQDSWNTQTAAPLDATTKVIARWVDRQGRMGDAAVLRSPRGQFMTHVLMAGDDGAKRRFVVESIVALEPAFKPAIAKAVVDRATEPLVGGAVRKHIDQYRSQIPASRAAEAEAKLDAANKATALARARVDTGGDAVDLNRVMDLAASAQADIRAATMLGFPTWPTEFRAVWCHDAAGIKGWSWDESAKRLAECGINVVIVNMLWGGRAYYPSEVLPRAGDLPEGADYLRDCIAACHKYGIAVHVWKVNYNLGGAPESFVERMRTSGRLQADRQGKELPWLSPSHPENFALERDSMLELVRKYDVDGIHFDYIRYPSAQADYSIGARQRFERAANVTVANWPADVISGPRKDQFQQWRQDQVSRLVEAVSAEAHRIRPGVKVSAAVFAEYPACREKVGQDWAMWAQRGWLDFICPMDYTPSAAQLEQWVKQQRALVGGKIPLYAGIGVTSSSSQLDPVQTAEQLMAARAAGAEGFVLFNYEVNTANEHLPALRLGVTAR